MNCATLQGYPVRLFVYSGTIGRRRPVRVSGAMFLPDGAEWAFEVGIRLAVARARHQGLWRGKGKVRTACIVFRRVPIPQAAPGVES